MKPPILECRDLSFRYGGEQSWVLQDLDLEIFQGEVVVLTGNSGSGKSTLLKCLNGLVPHFEKGIRAGEVMCKGQELAEMKMYEIAARIGSVFQDPRSQFFTTNTTEEVALGCENLGLERTVIADRIETAFSRLNTKELQDRDIFKLSSGEKQKIVLTAILAMQPDIFLLDEPSANLDGSSLFELRRILEHLKSRDKTIVVADHRLYYLQGLYDRLLCLKDGRIVEIFDSSEVALLADDEFTTKGLRCIDPSRITPKPVIGTNILPIRPESVALKIEHLGFRYAKRAPMILEEVNLTFIRGRITALTGLNGTGKTTFAKVLTGLLKETDGRILFQGKPLKPKERIGISHMVLQEADHQLFTDSVASEVTLGVNKIDTPTRAPELLLAKLDLADKETHHPQTLSGGEKQRLTIAAALARDPCLLVFDEPTSGMDFQNMIRFGRLLAKAAEKGRVLLVITHDVEFILRFCERVVIFGDRGIVADQSVSEYGKTLKNV